MGVDYAGRLGTGITVGDINNDGENELIASAPYGDLNGYTVPVELCHGKYRAPMLMKMGMALLMYLLGGVDCDDTDASIYPGRVEMTGNGIDDNCDGNIDDVVDTRTEPDLFEYDLIEAGWLQTDLFDFERSFSGDDGSSLYSSVGLSMFGSSQFRVLPNVYGTLPHGSLAGQVYNDGVTNQLRMYFTPSIEAIGFYILDPDIGTFSLEAFLGIQSIVTAEETLVADDIPGGAFWGLQFATPVDYLVLDGELGDGFGIDNIELVFTTYTDSDSDGFSEGQPGIVTMTIPM